MLVELIDHLWVPLFLREDLVRLVLHVLLVDVHQALDLVGVVLFLHCVLNILDEVLNNTLVLFGDFDSQFTVILKCFLRSFLVFDVLLHLLQTLPLHVKELL